MPHNMNTELPLEGIRVVDFCWVYAGPLMTFILGDLGAEVIKIESRKRLDGTRLGRSIVGDRARVDATDKELLPELQPLNHGLNRNKLSLTVDIADPRGLDLIHRLVRAADIVADNFAAGVMERRGLGYDELRQIKPDIIALSLSGAGQTGPLRDVLAYANTLAPLSGLGQLIGYDGEAPLGVTYPAFADANASIRAAGALLAALYHRNRTGEGQCIDVSEWECALMGIEEALFDYQWNGRITGPKGNHHARFAPHNTYPCVGKDQWVSIVVRNETEWAAFRQALGDPLWAAEERFADAYQRQQNLAVLDRHIAAWTREQTAQEVTTRLQAVGVPAFPAYTVEDIFADPHFQERGVVAEVEHPMLGPEHVPASPWKLNTTPPSVRRHAPLLGQDNDYVLRTVLGMSKEELEPLVEAQVVY